MFLFLLSHSSLHIQFVCIWFIIVVLVLRIALYFLFQDTDMLILVKQASGKTSFFLLVSSSSDDLMP